MPFQCYKCKGDTIDDLCWNENFIEGFHEVKNCDQGCAMETIKGMADGVEYGSIERDCIAVFGSPGGSGCNTDRTDVNIFRNTKLVTYFN